MTTPILAAEADGAYGVILPAPGELLYGIIAFTIVFVVLAKFAFPALGRVLDERASAIQGRMEEAEAKLAEAEEAKRRYESAISDAKGEAGRIIEEARQQADALRAEARERAETEAAQIIERAQADVAAERDRALQDLRNQVGSISIELASRIVERELDQSTHAALVDEYIERLSSQN